MKKSVLLAASACALILQGCSTFHPYTVGMSEPPESVPDCGNWTDESATCSPTGVAIQRAERLRYEYLRAAGHDELARKLAGSGLTLAASYALLLGVSSGIGPANANDQIMAIGAASAAGFGLTSIFTSPARQRVYVEGAKAVICVQQAATPFDLDRATLIAMSQMLNEENGLAADIAAVDSFVELLELSNASSTSKTKPIIAQYIVGVRREIEAARGALGRGFAALQESTDIAPQRVANQLGAVQVAVASQLNATTIDLNLISNIISNLKPAAAAIAPQYGPTTQTPPPEKTDARNTIETAASVSIHEGNEDALDRLAKMRTRAAFINSRGDDMERRITAAGRTIESCNFAPVELGLRLNTEKIAIKKGASSSFLVAEGQSPFVAEFAGAHAGIEVQFVPAFGNRAMVTVDNTASPGEYALSVYDRTLKPVTLTIKVE